MRRLWLPHSLCCISSCFIEQARCSWQNDKEALAEYVGNMMVRLLEYIVVKEDGQIVVILKGGIRCWRVMFKNT